LIVLIERIAEWSAADAALAVKPATREVPRMTTGLSLFFMGTGKTGTDRDVYREELAIAQMGAEALLSFFSYSGISSEESRRGLLLYSEEVLPAVGAWA
jgi:hypothetical protein